VTVSVTSPAQIPDSASSPRKTVYVAIGALLGIVLGVGGAFVREARDRRIRDEEDAASAAEAPVLAIVSERGGGKAKPLAVSDQPIAAPAEAYRRLRMNLDAVVDGNLHSLVVTSAGAGEGKTAVAANLGLVYAKAGHQVVVVDANLRRPALAAALGRSSAVGLSDLLLGKVAVSSVLQSWTSGVPLAVVGSGTQVPNPGELLGSQGFGVLLGELAERFELVVIDTPAVLAAADAALIARQASGALVVACSGATRADDLGATADSLRAADARVLGVVLNRPNGRGVFGRAAPSLYRNTETTGLPVDGERVSVP
jgi:capsular exopolysaccharide synthesis family protein